jgi:RNA polymerase sigma-70 factor (ECF subfamily)
LGFEDSTHEFYRTFEQGNPSMRDERQLRLVQRIQGGDATAENELFHRYKDPILWKICRLVKTDSENIKDLAGEIYLAILEGLRKQSFQSEQWETLEAYIWGVANNKIRDWFKKEKRENKLFNGDPPSEEIVVASEEYLLENEELGKLLKACLKTLEPKYKEALELRYFKELSVPEISARLGIPPRRVSERIHYALKLLRKAYQKRERAASILGWLFLLIY